MKQVLLALTAMLLTQLSFSQVAISNPASTPDGSAMLDVKSANKGFLMPRVANRTLIASPATGLLVYETATNAILVYNGTTWVQLGSSGGSSQWITNGNHIYNGNTGNVGVGVTAPSSKLHVLGNMLMDGTNPTIQLQNAGIDRGFMQLAGDNLRVGTNSSNNSGRFVVRLDGTDRVTVDSTGNMRIDGSEDASLTKNGYLMLGSENGTNIILDNNEIMARNNGSSADLIMQNDGGNVGIAVSPTERLHIDGSVRLDGGSRIVKFETAVAGPSGQVTVFRYAPGLQFIRSDNTVLGKMEYVDTLNAANFLRMYTGNVPRSDFTLSTAHNVGIGTADPQAKLHVLWGTGEQLRISGADPIIQFTDHIGTQDKKGYVRISSNDFVAGTNTANDLGNVILTANGNDVVKITPTANVGIGLGAGTPTAKLHVAGKIFANTGGEAIRIEGTDPAINFFQGGTQRGYVYNTGNDMQFGTSVASGRIFINSSKVHIGTSVILPDGYRLGVGGKMLCEELKVKLQSSGWPDYVFSNNYKLMPLADLQKFITDNNHLPNIPKASVIDKDGLEVGDMQRRLMEKVEELTLYIIDLQKQVDELKKKNSGN